MRLRGPVCNLFVIAAYIPHRGRVCPAQGDTLTDVQTVLSKVPPRDCVCLMGDFNEQLEANVQGATGSWTGGQASANSDKILSFLRLNKLLAISITFKPKKNKSVHTF